MDFENLSNFAAAQKVLAEAVATHQPTPEEEREALPTSERFDNVWDRAISLFKRPEGTLSGGVINIIGNSGTGIVLNGSIIVKEKRATPDTIHPTNKSLEINWSHQFSSEGEAPERLDSKTVTSQPDNPETLRQLRLLESSLDAVEVIAAQEHSVVVVGGTFPSLKAFA